MSYYRIDELAGALDAVRADLVGEGWFLGGVDSTEIARRVLERLDRNPPDPDGAPWRLTPAGEAAADPEITLMTHTLTVLRAVDRDTVQRYRRWVDERFANTKTAPPVPCRDPWSADDDDDTLRF